MQYLIDIDGDAYPIFLPQTATDWLWSGYCDFRAYEQAWFVANRTLQDEPSPEAEEAAGLAVTAMIASVAGLEVAHRLPLTVAGDDLGQMIRSGYQLGLDHEITQLRLYAHLSVVAATVDNPKYDPKELPTTLRLDIDYKTYVVQRDSSARVLAGKPLTTAEAVEVQEYRRLHNMHVSTLKGSHPTTVAGLDYTLGLTCLAMLVRPQGERIPGGSGARERWIASRREKLEHVDLATVKQVTFFLTAALLRLRGDLSTNSGRPVLRAVR